MAVFWSTQPPPVVHFCVASLGCFSFLPICWAAVRDRSATKALVNVDGAMIGSLCLKAMTTRGQPWVSRPFCTCPWCSRCSRRCSFPLIWEAFLGWSPPRKVKPHKSPGSVPQGEGQSISHLAASSNRYIATISGANCRRSRRYCA